ncbi:MAG: hypothetical protein M3010_12845 [Candidatus Dormibacteraeota bacterium]|nr:hypothetical protein [Candidatus Dormibacteraeota bacterium]
MPVHVDLAQFPRLVCRRCGLVALVDPLLPVDEHASLACPRCRGQLGRPRVSPANLPHEPSAQSRTQPVVPPQAPVPSHAAVTLAIAGLFLLLLFGFFVFLLLTPHTAHVNPYYPKP